MAVGAKPVSMGEPYSTDGIEENYLALVVGIVYQAVADYSQELSKKAKGARYSEEMLEEIENFLYTDERGFALTDGIQKVVKNGEVIQKINLDNGRSRLRRIPASHRKRRKNVVFDLYTDEGELIMSGTAKEIGAAFSIPSKRIYTRCDHKQRIAGYRAKRRAK